MPLAVVVPELLVDWGVPLSLVVVVTIALVWPRKLAVALAVVGCVATLALREVAITAIGRAMAQEQHAHGTWVPEYGNGMADIERYRYVTMKYCVIAVGGLVALVLRLDARSRK